MFQKIHAILFDLDGTLIDSMPRFAIIASDVIHRHFGVDRVEAREMYRKSSGLPFSLQLKSLFGNDTRIAEAAKEYENTKRKGLLDSPFFPDVKIALPQLKAKGYKLVVCSNDFEKNAERKMKPFSGCFDLILGYKKGFLKGPDQFRLVKEKLKLEFDNMIFVGDSLHDAVLAQEVGMPFVARVGTFSAAAFDGLGFSVYKISDFFALIRLMEDLTVKKSKN